jgi:hypothetical protein
MPNNLSTSVQNVPMFAESKPCEVCFPQLEFWLKIHSSLTDLLSLFPDKIYFPAQLPPLV